MKWFKNLENLAINKNVGECPYCKSLNTDYCFIVLNNITKIGYGAIWCNDCKHGYPLSRIKIQPGYKYLNRDEKSPIPKDIIF